MLRIDRRPSRRALEALSVGALVTASILVAASVVTSPPVTAETAIGAAAAPAKYRSGQAITGAGVTLSLGAAALPTSAIVDITEPASPPTLGGVTVLKAFTITAAVAGSPVLDFESVGQISAPSAVINPAGVALDRLRLASLTSDGWSPLPVFGSGDEVRSSIDAPGTYAFVAAATGSVSIGHYVWAQLGDETGVPAYLAADTPMLDATTWQRLRVRFQLGTAGSAATITPRLEYRARGEASFRAVPNAASAGAAFFVDREWVDAPAGATGTVPSGDGAAIAAGELKLGAAGAIALPGHHSMGRNPDVDVSLDSGSVTEQEFTLRASGAAPVGTTYEIRLTDAGAAMPAAVTAIVRIAAPVAALSAGQRQGKQQAAAVRYPLKVATGTNMAGVATAAAAATSARSATATAVTAATATTAIVAETDIHGPYTMTASQCSICHRSHSAKSVNLISAAAPAQGTLCFTCHDGTGAPNVAADFRDAAIPANDPATRTFYGHEVLTISAHQGGGVNEFGGVSDRHSECADCHNPHRAANTASVETTAGWSAPGALAGASGVAVVNGPAGSTPTYSFLDGSTAPLTLEYQLCLKCHSGFTVLPTNTGFTPSQYTLDKSVEFNPANTSFHPVEAAGTNRTAAMAASLAGTSPYKLWNFSVTSTIRCVNCHANGSVRLGAPGAGADLPSHRSPNRGILLANYRDRLLKPTREAYSAADFALCYLCHAEAPFAGASNTATNFRLHSMHVRGISDKGTGGTAIDTAGAGQGNAVCAECHYRLHSVVYRVDGQATSGTRLVNFSPNIQASNGVLAWTPGATSGGSCTLTCHGERHSGYRY